MAIKSVLLDNFDDLQSKLSNPINYVDIDYNLLNPESSQGFTKTRSTILHGDYAILNAYRLWLQSKKYDYIRSPTFGGIFEFMLNDKFSFSTDNEENVAEYIREKTASHWPQIVLLGVEVKADMNSRIWNIHLIAQDKRSGMILNDSFKHIVS